MKAASPNNSVLGKGIYSAADVARYGRIPSARMVSRWVRSTRPVIRKELPDDPDRVLTFLDFAQLQAVRAIRLHDPRITLEKIREAIDWHEENHKLSYPLARRHKVIWHDGQLYIHVEGVDDPKDPNRFRQASGTGKEQIMFPEIAELYQLNMFYHEGGLAREFVLYREENRRILMNPEVGFGEPIIEGVGYTLDAVLNAYQAEGGVALAARALGIDDTYVQLALGCRDHLGLQLDAA